MNKMFCFQCERTDLRLHRLYRQRRRLWRKKADTAELQDRLTGALIGLARAFGGNENLITPETDKLFIEGLFTAFTNVNFNNTTINALIERIEAEKRRILPQSPFRSWYGRPGNGRASSRCDAGGRGKSQMYGAS